MKGLLLVNKPKGLSSFWLIPRIRRLSAEKRVGHGGTLDPFATGLMVYLLGREFTRLAEKLLHHDKVYRARFTLGTTTDTYDCTGQVVKQSDLQPDLAQLKASLDLLQGDIQQVPPMFSAKQVQGKRLYKMARQGQTIERASCSVRIKTTLIAYEYPHIDLEIHCSKGTYVRSIAHDLGEQLGCGAFVSELCRLRSGPFLLEEALDGQCLHDEIDLTPHLLSLEAVESLLHRSNIS